MLDDTERQHIIDEIAEEIRVCTKCPLHQGRKHAVPGEGSCMAQVMFVGEAPGYHEDQQGRPFVGQAGQLFDNLLKRAGLNRSDIYIANILKCRPPNNRDPSPEEAAACREYLDAQIAAVQPQVVCLMGRVPLQALLMPSGSITRLHGCPQEKHGIIWLPLFHPAAALHRPAYLPQLYQDMDRLRQLLAERSLRR
jgi:uracil-DNA glycosylase family 4